MLQKTLKENLPQLLLAWFGREGRRLPWRTKAKRDPYRVWLSEVMLQQTTVTAVIPYFQKFLKLYPTVGDLAAAPLEDVLKHWAGLGYYARARNLHKCAREIVEKRAGRFPETEAELRALPGIGAYTAAAMAAIAFGESAAVVDGNVERVMARLYAVKTPLPKAKPKLKALAAKLTPEKDAGVYAEAIMDLGATVCTPTSPACPRCPWMKACKAYANGLQESLPKRTPPKQRPVRHGTVFWLENKGRVLVRRRPPTGLLGGMLEIPSSEWKEIKTGLPAARKAAPAKTDWRLLDGTVEHTFTHFHLVLRVMKGEGQTGGQWMKKEELLEAGFPSVQKKVIRKVLADDQS